MSQRSKRELLAAIRPRYLKANKAGKTRMLDEFVAATRYHRKYDIRLLGMNRSTIDCCLQPARFEHYRGLSTTKPESLHKKVIPVRTYAQCDACPAWLCRNGFGGPLR